MPAPHARRHRPRGRAWTRRRPSACSCASRAATRPCEVCAAHIPSPLMAHAHTPLSSPSAAHQGLDGRFFDKRRIEARFFDEQRFADLDFQLRPGEL